GGAKDTRRILADLHACFPATPGAIAAGVRQALGPANAALLARARAAVAAGDARALGELMTEAQDRFDRLVAPACPELAAPRLHLLRPAPQRNAEHHHRPALRALPSRLRGGDLEHAALGAPDGCRVRRVRRPEPRPVQLPHAAAARRRIQDLRARLLAHRDRR